MRRRALASLVLVACSSSPRAKPPAPPSVPLAPGSPWPKFRGNAAQTGAGSVHASQQGGSSWKVTTGAGIFSSPVVASDGTVYFGSADRIFRAVNADGSARWSITTGEIIDSSGLLDDLGHVYFGSGDGVLRAADAKTGAVLWQFAADDPRKTGGFINWFEGNVAIGPGGALYVPNDNFLVYAIDRTRGTPLWSYRMPDQTWSLPAVDAATGTLFVGNNNLLPVLGKNTFSIDRSGTADWADSSLGTVAASPLLTQDGKMVVGGFDGYLRAYAQADGRPLWSTATRDHIYASPAALPDGTIVQPSADGTVYAVSPATGVVRWTFDTGTPIRSSPAVDADGHVYVGGGDGRLYVLDPGGSLRFSMQLISDVRNDLNSSPALGASAVYLGGESGEMFSVPYDFCLRGSSAGDPRCATSPAARPDGATLSWVNPFGDTQPAPPASMAGNARITLLLDVRSHGASELAVLDATSVQATVQPPVPVAVDVSGDGKFLTITPQVAFAPGPLSVQVRANYLVGLQRAGLRLSGGSVGGSTSAQLSTTVSATSGGALDPAASYELSRLSIPLPTVMPSYNQIGFDQLHYLLGTVRSSGTAGVAWMVGGVVPPGATDAVVDPATQAVFPLAVSLSEDLATMNAGAGLQVQIMSFTLPFQSFRLGLAFAPGGQPAGNAEISGSAVCGSISFYGPFLQQLGLCNPQTDVIRVLGASNVRRRDDLPPPPAAGQVTFSLDGGDVLAAVTGSGVKPAEHLAGVLLVDSDTGQPVTLAYGTGTTRTTAPDGTLATVRVPVSGATLPPHVIAYLMVDTTVGASGSLP